MTDEKRIKTLSNETSSLQGEVDKLRAKSSGINEQVKELQNKILEVGGVKLRAIQSKVQTTKGLLDLANESIIKAEVGQAKAERDAEKLVKSIEANRVKLEETDAELAVVEGDLQACTSDLNVLKEKVQEAVDASTDVQEALSQSKAELDEKTEGINGFRALEVSAFIAVRGLRSDGFQTETRGQCSFAERLQGQAETLEQATRGFGACLRRVRSQHTNIRGEANHQRGG